MKETKETKLLCTNINGTYRHFYPTIECMEMCSVKRENVIAVSVEEAPEGHTKYYAWWDNEAGKFMHVYKDKVLVDMCFPNGCAKEEEKGKGKLYPVSVTQI